MRKFLERLNGLVLFILLIVTVLMVFFRMVLQQSAAWGEGLGQMGLVLICFIGSAAIMKDESHIKITILSDRLHGKKKIILNTFNRICTLAFLAVFVIGSYQSTLKNWTVNDPIISWMKSGYLYLVLLLSGVIMAVYTVINAVSEFKESE